MLKFLCVDFCGREARTLVTSITLIKYYYLVILNDKGQDKIREFNDLYSLPGIVSFVLNGIYCILNVMSILEMRYLSKVLIVNLQRKSSFDKPGRSKDENTTLGFLRIRVL
jgi:hypothetical protein